MERIDFGAVQRMYESGVNRRVREVSIATRLARRMGCRVWQSLRQDKPASWTELVGYTVVELMAHLESKFQPGMTWDNYGEWHIDHIRPISTFVFQSYADPTFLECWGLANLQPLWAIDNLRKSGRWTR